MYSKDQEGFLSKIVLTTTIEKLCFNNPSRKEKIFRWIDEATIYGSRAAAAARYYRQIIRAKKRAKTLKKHQLYNLCITNIKRLEKEFAETY